MKVGMMKVFSVVAVLSSSCLPMNAQEVGMLPNTDIDPSKFSERAKFIIPGRSAYGVPWYCTEQEMRDQLGPPVGVITVNPKSFILIYGKTHAFIFENNEFRELHISIRLIDYKIRERLVENPFFDPQDWVIDPGLLFGMPFEEVRELMGTKILSAPSHNAGYATDLATVNMSFVRNSSTGEYKLGGLVIRGH